MILGAVMACALLGAARPTHADTAPPAQQPDAVQATPITGGTSYGGATQLTPNVEYSSTVSTSATDDFFYFDVTPGQIATMVFTSSASWSGSGYFYFYDQLHVSYLGSYVTLSTQEQPGQLIHVGNSTTPTRYYFRVEGSGAAKDYLFKLTLEDQTDGGPIGDAGDTANTARVITPTVGSITSFTGSSGGKDADDWYRINVAAGQRISVTSRILDYGIDNTGYVDLYDAAEPNSTIVYNTHAAPSLEPKTFQWMSNSTTPGAYLIRAEMGTTGTGAPLRYQFDVLVTDQTDGGPVGDAGDTAVTARVITPTLGVIATYTGTTGQKDADDWFRINAVSGMRISVTATIVDFGVDNQGYADLYDAANTASTLLYNTYNTAGVPQSLSYMANNTAPSAYLIRMEMGTTVPGAALTYRFTVLAEQQTDGNTPGDAGDDFDSARIITPTLNAISNTLGSADNDDYYKIDLPIDPTTGVGAGVPFKIFVAPVPWPSGSSGSLVITKYGANRAQVGESISIAAPTTDGATIDLRDCDGCYIKVTDNSSGIPQLKYIFTLIKPFTSYMPFIRKP